MKRIATALTLLVLVAGCSMIDGRARAMRSLRGVALSPAQPKPAFTLTDTRGAPYEFSKETSGRVALLYFGYTNCPDVCPAQLSRIAAALKGMSAADRERVRVVFVTTDPARDSVARLRGWLDGFDRSFIGLRGDMAEVNRVQASLGLPPSVVEAMPASGAPHVMTYGVGHAAQVLAFTPDDSLRVEYPDGFQVADWVNDLPRLLAITKR